MAHFRYLSFLTDYGLEDGFVAACHGVRGGRAMIATLRWRLIAVPGRLIRHARHLILRLPPGHGKIVTEAGVSCLAIRGIGSDHHPVDITERHSSIN